MRWIARSVCALALAFTSLCGQVISAHALNLSPSSADFSVLPGGIGEAVVTVKNETGVEREYQVQFVGVTFEQDGGSPIFTALEPGVAAMLSAQPASLTLRPDDGQDVIIRFAAPPGGYSGEFTAAALFVERTEVTSGVSVGAGYAVMLFGSIGTEGESAYQVARLEVKKKWFSSLPVEFGAILENIGDQSVKPMAIVQIRRTGSDEVLFEAPLNPYGQRVPAGTSRLFTATWGSVEDAISWGALLNTFKNPFGSFEMRIVDESGDLVAAQVPIVHFSIIPYHFLILIGGVGGVVLFGILSVRVLQKRASHEENGI